MSSIYKEKGQPEFDEPMETNTTRVHGIAYFIVIIMTVLGLLLVINQVFFLRIGGFMPMGNAFYYLVLGRYLGI